MRRQTLGVLNLAKPGRARLVTDISHKSVLPGPHNRGSNPSIRPSLNGKPPRPSMPPKGTRTSYMPSQAINTGIQQDPRPLKDKEYNMQNMKMLLAFLTQQQYDQALGPNTLTAPSIKEFHRICLFIFQQLDHNFKFGKKPEDDIVSVFKMLGYPFSISKTALASAGSPHTWPTLLAALCWIIEGNAFREEADILEKKNPSESAEFFTVTTRGYHSYLLGEDDEERLENDLSESSQNRNKIIQDESMQLEQAIDQIKVQVDEAMAHQSTLLDIQQQQKDLTADRERFKKLIKNMQKHKSTQEEKIDDIKNDCENAQTKLNTMRKEQTSLNEQIDAQIITPEQIQSMSQEKSRLRETITSLTSQKESILTDCWNLEKKITSILSELEKCENKYNDQVHDLELSPSNAKYAEGKEYNLKINTDGKTMGEVLSVDLTHDLKPTLIKMKEKFIEKLRNSQSELRQLQSSLKRSTEFKHEKTQEITLLEGSLEKMHRVITEQKQNLNSELREGVSKVEDLELEIRKIRMQGSANLQQAEQTLIQLDNEISHLKEQFKEEETNLHNELCLGMDALTTHKVYVTTQLEALNKHLKEVEKNVLEDI